MTELVRIDNQQVVTDSRSVAKHFEKQHKHVLETITKLVSGDRPKIGPMFHETKEAIIREAEFMGDEPEGVLRHVASRIRHRVKEERGNDEEAH